MVELLDLVLEKKELRGVSRAFASSVLDAWLKKHPNVLEEYGKDPERFPKKKAFQELRGGVRAELRELYGVFFMQGYPGKRDKLLSVLCDTPSRENANKLLMLHRSTNERVQHYGFLYQQLFAIGGTPKSVLDLGCGFNPYSYPYMMIDAEYHAADIACDDLTRIGAFFDAIGTKHSEHCMDLTDIEGVKKLPRVDVAFAFKLFDSLETRKRNITAEILKALPAKILIASFPTLSISQKGSIDPREWFERLVTGRVLGRVTLPNESFVIVTLEEKGTVTNTQQ